MRGAIVLRWVSVSWVLGVASGCRPDAVVAIERPAIDGAESWVLALLGDEGARFFAQDLDRAEPIRFTSDADERAELEAYVFDVPLAALGLTPGPLTPAADDAASARVLTAPLRIVRRALDAPSWDTVARGDLRLAEARFARTTPCRTVEVRSEPLGTVDKLRWVLPIDDDRALVGSDSGELRWASRTSAPRRAFLVPQLGAMAATMDRARRVALGSASGEITELDLAGANPEQRQRTWLPVPQRIIRMAGDAEDLGRELWVLTASGAVYQRTQGAWIERYRFSRDLAGSATDGGIVWLSPGRALVGYASEAFAVELDGDRSTQRQVFQQSLGLLSMQRLSDGTLVAGSFSGVLARSTDGVVWEDLGRTPDGLNAYGFAGRRDVFWYVGVFGTLGEYRDGVGYCPTSQMVARGGEFSSVVTLGAGMLAIGRTPNEEPSWTWLDPR